MKVLSREKVKVLAEKNGWSLSQAEGYVDGETFRRRGKTPSKYAQIGIDEYCLGFRAGYYERHKVVVATGNLPGPLTRQPLQRPTDTNESFAVSTVMAAQRG